MYSLKGHRCNQADGEVAHTNGRQVNQRQAGNKGVAQVWVKRVTYCLLKSANITKAVLR